MPISPEQQTSLCQAATQVARNAYAPYSNFFVGAALLTASGEVFTGCNVENGSFGLSVCAERGAIVSAVNAGQREFVAIAISSPSGAFPCGACRQFLHEFASGSCEIVLCNESGDLLRMTTLSQLFPDSFDGPSD